MLLEKIIKIVLGLLWLIALIVATAVALPFGIIFVVVWGAFSMLQWIVTLIVCSSAPHKKRVPTRPY